MKLVFIAAAAIGFFYWLVVTLLNAVLWAGIIGALVLIAKGGYALWRWCR